MFKFWTFYGIRKLYMNKFNIELMIKILFLIQISVYKNIHIFLYLSKKLMPKFFLILCEFCHWHSRDFFFIIWFVLYLCQFCALLQYVDVSCLDVYKLVSDKSKKCLSVDNSRILPVVNRVSVSSFLHPTT